MQKVSIKPILVLLICVLLSLATACVKNTPVMVQPSTDPQAPQATNTPSTENQNTSMVIESVCSVTKDKVGHELWVTGKLGVIDRDNPDGVYADLEEDRCHAGIWITKEQWKSWTGEEQTLLKTGNYVVAKGQLNSFQGNLILELNSPLGLVAESVSEPSSATIGGDTKTVVASALDQINLVPVPLTEKRLTVEKIYSGGEGPGLCYLGAYAMLARYEDREIDFSDVIANSGIGTSAFYIPEINLLLNGFEIGSIAVAAQNQGFSYYISALDGATLTDEFMAQNLVERAESIISVNSQEEGFILLKRLISSDTPVIVHLDINYIRNDLISYCPYWKDIFDWQDRNMSSTHIDHYMSVNGYDTDFIYLNDPTEKQDDLGQDIPIKIDRFLAAWENGNHPSFGEESRIGPFWMLFLGKRGIPMSNDELLSWNKDIAVEAIPSIRLAAVNPNVSELIQCNGMYRSRKEFATFLLANGYSEAGDIFSEISELFGNLCQSRNQRSDMLKIADLQEQSLAKW